MKFEHEIIKFLQSNVNVSWISFFQFVTMLGSFLGFFITLAIIFYKNRKLSFALIASFAIGSLFNYILKIIIRRARPFESYGDIANLGNEDGYSMPSGHSFCVSIFATFLIYTLFTSTKDKLKIISGSFASVMVVFLVAFSRMVLGVHYLTDTLLGIALGAIVAITFILLNNMLISKYQHFNRKE